MTPFDIIGPVMVGPSSSHTAGAVKIGLAARNLLGEAPTEAEILFYGSFLATGKGHGTDRAVAAGLLGMQPDDMRIPQSLTLAEKNGLRLVFGEAHLREAHPNTVQLNLKSASGRKLEVIGESTGGGRINIAEVDGIDTNFSGDFPTLIVHNVDRPGHIAEVTSLLARNGVNIAKLTLYRLERGGRAVMVVECDQEIPADELRHLEKLDGIEKVTYLSLAGG